MHTSTLTLRHCARVVVCENKGFGSQARPDAAPKKVKKEPSIRPERRPPAGGVYTPEHKKQQVDDAPSVAEGVPQQISGRILRRILLFSGLPTFAGFLSLPLFYYLKVIKHLDIPTWAVYVSSFFTFGVGLLGISYGALSSSWEAREGTSLGIDEFKRNLPRALDRTRPK